MERTKRRGEVLGEVEDGDVVATAAVLHELAVCREGDVIGHLAHEALELGTVHVVTAENRLQRTVLPQHALPQQTAKEGMFRIARHTHRKRVVRVVCVCVHLLRLAVITK
jgi:hypothetical protein